MKKSKILVYMLCVLVLVLCLAMAGCAADDAPVQPDAPQLVENTAQPVENNAAAHSDSFAFSTTAIDGSTVDESLFEGKKLIMINLWEPWCGPCVQEMPALEKLYQEYKLLHDYFGRGGNAVMDRLYDIYNMATE